MKRYLVQLPQDSTDLASMRTYCLQHGIDIRREHWHMGTREFVFTVAYALDGKYVSWLELKYPNCLVAF